MVRNTVLRICMFIVLTFTSLLLSIYYVYIKNTARNPFQMSYEKTLDNCEPLENLQAEAAYGETYAYSITGKEFDFDKRTTITAQTILRTQTFAKKSIAMQNKAALPPLVPVTAISSNHFQELTDHIAKLPRFFGDVKLVLFDLGLTEEQVQAIRKMSLVEYRKFDFLKYPPHVANLINYAWKILIIQETLAEFEAIMWMDASVMLTGTYLPAIDQMVKENSSFLFFNHLGSNRVLSVTHPNMLDYLPVVRASAMRTNHMALANGMIIFNTLQVQRDVMKWAVLCALCKNCIAPLEAKLDCREGLVGKADYFIDCHRYDQAVFNVLVANINNFEMNRYTFNGKRFSQVIRYPMARSRSGQK